MIPVNNKIIVKCDINQKNTILISGSVFRLANLYEQNYRVKSPTIATVVEGNSFLRNGDILLCHHNLYFLPSPYHLGNDLFSVPFSKVLFAKILQDGELMPICGNIFGERIPKKYSIPIPPDKMEKYNDRMIISNPGYTRFKVGQTVFARPSSCYDIIYNWENEQKTVTKISEDMLTGIMK